MSTVNRSGSVISMPELQGEQAAPSQLEQSQSQPAVPHARLPAAALEADLVELKDPGHLRDAFRGFDKLRHERTMRVFTGSSAGLGALGTAIGLAPAALSAAHSCDSESKTANPQACQSAKASIVGAAFGVIGISMSIVGWKLGATHFSSEVKEMDRKLLARYSRILQSRIDAGEQFPHGRPNIENIVSRYMGLNKKDRQHINDALEISHTDILSEDAADNV